MQKSVCAAAVAVCLFSLACDRKTPSEPSAGAPRALGGGVVRGTTIASLSPAATDLLIAIGAAERLVAVSNFDTSRAEAKGLPHVGDYQSQDWDKLAELRPAKLIVQLREDQTQRSLRGRAKGLGIEVVNVHIDTLEDVFAALTSLSAAVGEADQGEAAAKKLRAELETVRRRVAAHPKLRTLVVVDEAGRSAAGRGTFLDDILTFAGGENVAAESNEPWPTVDRAKVLELAPETVIHLLPGASPDVLRRAKEYWASMPDLPAVKRRHVHCLTDDYVLIPGPRVGKVAEQFAMVLHPFADVGPAEAR